MWAVLVLLDQGYFIAVLSFLLFSCKMLLEYSTLMVSLCRLEWEPFCLSAFEKFPLTDDISTFQDSEKFESHCSKGKKDVEGKFVCARAAGSIADGSNDSMITDTYNELKQREDKLAKHYVRHRDGQYQNCQSRTKIDKSKF